MILIFTPYSFSPIHPRLEYIEKYLVKNEYEVKKYNLRSRSKIINKLNWLSLTFFQVPSFFKAVKYLWKYRQETKIVYIQDLQYLPIAIIAKICRKKVIYDTLDNNAELIFYHLSNRFTIFQRISFLKSIIIYIEKNITKYFCDEIIVNSKALVEYLKPNKTHLIYYTSPFEKKFKINTNNEIAFLYLGGFWKMKGAEIILGFIEEHNKKLFIFGTLSQQEKDIINKIDMLKNKNLIFFRDRMSSRKLEKELTGLFDKYKLIGFSLTQDVNKSNATQEINKDIDYLAMGIPIIGNHRKPTEEKIDEGCGVFLEDERNIEKLLNDEVFYQLNSNNCINYYDKYYAQNIFEKKLLEVVSNV